MSLSSLNLQSLLQSEPKILRLVDNLLLDHVGLLQVVIVAVHLVIFLLDG